MIEGMLELFGTRLALMFAGVALLYLLWSTAPIWWSLQHVLRHSGMQQRWGFAFTGVALVYGATALLLLLFGGLMKLHDLPHPLAYIAVAAALGYGFVGAVYVVAILPMQVVANFFVPQMLEAGTAGGVQLHNVSKFMSALAVPLLISLPFSAIFGSITLHRRCRALCGLGLQENVEHR